ncbi:uncharacterized [Lates japonicus]
MDRGDQREGGMTSAQRLFPANPLTAPLPAVSTLPHLSLVATAAAPSRLCEALFELERLPIFQPQSVCVRMSAFPSSHPLPRCSLSSRNHGNEINMQIPEHAR